MVSGHGVRRSIEVASEISNLPKRILFWYFCVVDTNDQLKKRYCREFARCQFSEVWKMSVCIVGCKEVEKLRVSFRDTVQFTFYIKKEARLELSKP
jgi:hypothetical protein